MEEEIKKDENMENEELLKLKRSNGKKNAIIIIMAFTMILMLALVLIYYFSNKNANEPENNDNGSGQVVDNVSNNQLNDDKDDNQTNSYKIYSNNLKNKIKSWNLRSVLAKNAKYYGNNTDIDYKVILTNKMELIMVFDDPEYAKKLGEVKIADNVIDFYLAQTGPGAYENVYFINENGTLGEAIPWELISGNSKKIPITNPIPKTKNIVSVVQISYEELGYMQEPAAIDINGNVIELPSSAWD